MRITTTLKLKEPKKHSARYDALDSDAPVSSIYVSKRAWPIGTTYPDTITLTIDDEAALGSDLYESNPRGPK